MLIYCTQRNSKPGNQLHNQLHSNFFERLGGRIGIYISTIHWFTLWRNQSKTQNGPAWQRNHATCQNVRLPLLVRT